MNIRSVRRDKTIRTSWKRRKNRRTRNWLSAIEKSSTHRWITACSKIWTIHRNGYVSAGQTLMVCWFVLHPFIGTCDQWSRSIYFNFCIVYAPAETIQGREQSAAKAKTRWYHRQGRVSSAPDFSMHQMPPVALEFERIRKKSKSQNV